MSPLLFPFFLVASLCLACFGATSKCSEVLDYLGEVASDSVVTLAVDYDSTAVDTDSFLARTVIPHAISSFLPAVPVAIRPHFENFLIHLENNGASGMPLSYDEREWSEAEWPFPLQHLPSELAARSGLEPPVSALVGFWDVLSEVFDRFSNEEICVIPEFARFFTQVNARLGHRVHWVVVTARFKDQAAPIQSTFQSLGTTAHPLTVIHRGEKGAVGERQVPMFKAARLSELQQNEPRPLRLFIDNDLKNLNTVRTVLGPSVKILQMQRQANGESVLVEVP